MDRTWPDEAIDFEAAVRGALTRLGAAELTRRCEADPGLRETLVLPALSELGVLELDMRSGPVEAAAAARAVRAAGACVCPWPLVPMLTVPTALRETRDAVYLTDGAARRLEHLDLTHGALCLDIDTQGTWAVEHGATIDAMPLDPFGVACEPGEAVTVAATDLLEAGVILSAFWVSGALTHVRDLAVVHARERRQFGRRISEFGGVQWRLSDIAVAHDGLWELASFTLARFIEQRLQPADTLALLFTTIDSARTALDNAHQVLAAIGLCEEHDLTLVERHLQPVLRRTGGLPRVLGLLSNEIHTAGFDNLYPVGPALPADDLAEVASA